MRKLLILLLGLAALVGLAFLLAPSLLPIAEQAEQLKARLQADGLRMEYDGTPQAGLTDGGSLRVENLRIYDAAAPAGNPPLLKAVEAKVQIDPTTLFSDQPKLSALALHQAELTLEAGSLREGKLAGHVLAKLLALPLKFHQSRLNWVEGGDQRTLEALEGWAALREGQGPLEAELSARLDGHDWKLVLQWQEPLAATPGAMEIKLSDAATIFQLAGKLGQADSGWQGSGQWQVESTHLWPSLQPGFALFRHEKLKDLPAAEIKASGGYQLTGGTLTLSQLKLASGTTQLTGEGTIRTEPAPDVRLQLKASEWNLDPLRVHLDAIVAALRDSHTASLSALNLPGWDAGSQHVPMLPENTVVQCMLDADRLQLNGKPLQQAKITLNHVNGNWILQEARASLPGAEQMVALGRLSESGEGWRFRGRVEGKGTSLRQVLDWLTVPLPPLPDDRLQAFQGALAMDWMAGRLQLSDMHLTVDDSQLAGAVVYTPAGDNRPLPSLQTSLRLNRLDLDRYFPPASLLAEEATRRSSRESLQQVGPVWLEQFPLQLDVALAAAELQVRSLPLSSLQLRLAVQPKLLDIKALDGVVDEAALHLTGSLASQLRRPKLTLQLTSGRLTLESIHAFLHGKRETLSPSDWRSPAGSAVAWKDEAFDTSLWGLADGDISLTVEKLVTPNYPFNHLRCHLIGADSLWQFSQCGVQWLEGSWVWQGTLAAKELLEIKGQLGVSGLDVAAMMQGFSTVESLAGRLAVNSTLQSSGTSPVQLLQSLQLNSNFIFSPLQVTGFDLGTIAQKVPYIRSTADIANLSRIALSGGATEIESLQGIAYVKDGVLQIPASSLATESTEGHIQSAIDLPRLVMRNELAFKVRSTLASDIPPLTIRWQGALETPERQLDTRELENYISNRAIERQFR